jgi:hypothetical protein
MRTDLALPLSITLLAGAITLHALSPASAQEAPVAQEPLAAPAPVAVAPAPVVATAAVTAPLGPECTPIRLGTAREYEKVITDLTAPGRRSIAVIDSGLVCAW